MRKEPTKESLVMIWLLAMAFLMAAVLFGMLAEYFTPRCAPGEHGPRIGSVIVIAGCQ